MTKEAGASSAKITVRRARVGDADQLAELSGELGYPATPEQIVKRLGQLMDHPEHAVYVACREERENGERVIGWIHVHERSLIEADLRAEIGGLIVAEGARGSGAGRMLMKEAERWARERGCAGVIVRSNVVRAAAHAFYEALGYRVTKQQKAFFKEL